MLQSISVKNVVLIEDIHIDFLDGLCALTGETGAGKSILLDALGLALGERSDISLIRQGADKAQVTAIFSLTSTHIVWQELEEQDISFDNNQLILRRVLSCDGKSRAFINDQLVSLGFLRKIAESLIEIHGQFDSLLETKTHLKLVDEFSEIDTKILKDMYRQWKMSENTFQEAIKRKASAQERENFLKVALEDLDRLGVKTNEEDSLESERQAVSHKGKIIEALQAAQQGLMIPDIVSRLSTTYKSLERIENIMPEVISPLLQSLTTATVEVQEVMDSVGRLFEQQQEGAKNQEEIENRLYDLRNAARKHNIPVNDLPLLVEQYRLELNNLMQGDGFYEQLEKQALEQKKAYIQEAQRISVLRKLGASQLIKDVKKELAPLKFEQTDFEVSFKDLYEEHWSDQGVDSVEFLIAPNPGLPLAPLNRIASGGERSRLMLAFKVVLVRTAQRETLIFDEIDSGTGGAVASAIGERLARLADMLQVITITHSPQVAACAKQHMLISKAVENENTKTYVRTLKSEEREEEIARMLSGSHVTNEARAAAQRLMGVDP